MKIGDTVITPDGIGVIKNIETFRTSKRYGVQLEKNLKEYEFQIVYYFEKELKLKQAMI